MVPLYFLVYVALLLFFVYAMAYLFVKGEPGVTPSEPIDAYEMGRLHFAAATCACLELVFLVAIGAAVIYSCGEREILTMVIDVTKVVLPPLGALVLGYFFGKSGGGRPKT